MSGNFKDLVESLDQDGLNELRRSLADELGQRRQQRQKERKRRGLAALQSAPQNP